MFRFKNHSQLLSVMTDVKVVDTFPYFYMVLFVLWPFHINVPNRRCSTV